MSLQSRLTDLAAAVGADIKAIPIVRSGLGVPTNSVGKVGDFYMDLITGLMYGPKAAVTPARSTGAEGQLHPNGSVENGVTTGWGVSSSAGSGVFGASNPTTDRSQDGRFAFRGRTHRNAQASITATITTTPAGTGAIPVQAGQFYSVGARAYSRAIYGMTGILGALRIYWYKADGSASTVVPNSVQPAGTGRPTLTDGVWREYGWENVQAPSDAAFARVELNKGTTISSSESLADLDVDSVIFVNAATLPKWGGPIPQEELDLRLDYLEAEISGFNSRMAKPCMRVVEIPIANYTSAIANLDNGDRVLAVAETNKGNNGVWIWDQNFETFSRDSGEVYTPGRIFPVVHKTMLSSDRDYANPNLWVCTSAEGTTGLAPDGIQFEKLVYKSNDSPPAGGMEFIGEVTTVAGQTTITFNNIPQNYKDLKLFGQVRSTVAAENVGLRLSVNNNATAGYNHAGLQIDSAAAPAKFAGVNTTRWHLGQMAGSTQAAGAWSGIEATFPDYSRANDPLVHFRMNTGYSGGELFYEIMGRKHDIDAPITRIDLFDANGSAFVAGSTVRLYGTRIAQPVSSAPGEVHNLSGAATYDVLGLDGDTEGPYRIILDGVLTQNGSGVDRVVKVRPNNNTSGFYSNMVHFGYMDATPNVIHAINRSEGGTNMDGTGYGIAIAQNHFAQDGRIGSEGVLGVKSNTGGHRIYQGAYWHTPTGYSWQKSAGQRVGDLENTAANITSLRFDFGGGLFTGTIRIEKLGVPTVAARDIQRVTVLPSNPYHGQEIDFVASASAGVIWRLRYNATSSSPYKWEFVGGQSLYSEDMSGVPATSSATYVALAGAPSIALPLAGDYEFEHGVQHQSELQSSSLAGPWGATSDAESVYGNGTKYRKVRKTGVSAGTVSQQGRTNSGASNQFLRRFLSAIPIRVG